MGAISTFSCDFARPVSPLGPTLCKWRPPPLSRRVGKVVGYPPLTELSDQQRREFQEALLDRRPLRRVAWQVAGGDPQGGAEPAEAAACLGRLVLFERSLVSQPRGLERISFVVEVAEAHDLAVPEGEQLVCMRPDLSSALIAPLPTSSPTTNTSSKPQSTTVAAGGASAVPRRASARTTSLP